MDDKPAPRFPMPGLLSAHPHRPAFRRVKASLTAAVTACTLVSCQSLKKNHVGGDLSGTSPASSSERQIEPPALPVDPKVVYKMAHVETVRASLAGSGEPLAKVVITGWLNDGATSIREVKQQRDGQSVLVTVITARPRDAMATLALIPFERTITVDLAGMAAGPVTITVNGVTSTVMR
ncbi:MAG TPA: hypothetical protein VK956_21225 [Verrucomicrobium sp.]|nr:hypothetical protein [Verrucomicrobium sp.]